MMKFAIVGVCVALLCVAACVDARDTSVFNKRLRGQVSEAEARQLFADFKKKYNKIYSMETEHEMRYAIFKQSLARAALKNAEDRFATYGVTKFSDLTPQEFQLQYIGKRGKPRAAIPQVGSSVLPRSAPTLNVSRVDWREKGAVTPVKNQGQCGSCWAFSTVEEIESMWYLKNGTLHDFSTQQVVDCDNVDQGCNGGDPPTAYKYVQQAGGLELNSNYPYFSGNTGSAGQCNAKRNSIVALPLRGFSYAVPPCNGGCGRNTGEKEKEMASKLADKGPISICVDASTWQDYNGGVVTDGCERNANSLDHCVQLVGYDMAGSTPYWMVRNSWAADWGLSGYIHIAMGSNLCGIQDEATFADF